MSIHKLTETQLPGEVNEDLIGALDDLLERAKRGEVTALAWCGVTGNHHLFNGWDGAGGTTFSLGAGIMALNSRYASFMMEED